MDIELTNNSQLEVASLYDYEKRMIALICEAKSDHDIAQLMNMNSDEVNYCKSKIFQKTKTHSWAELVIYAIRKSIFTLHF